IFYGNSNICQHSKYPFFQLIQDIGISLSVNFNMNHCFRKGIFNFLFSTAKNFSHIAFEITLNEKSTKVDNIMDIIALTVNFDTQRIQQKWHIVTIELDDSVSGLPAILLILRIINTQLKLTRFAFVHEMPKI